MNKEELHVLAKVATMNLKTEHDLIKLLPHHLKASGLNGQG
jgi:hypothetical protein